MAFEAWTGAAVIALLGTAVFALTARTWLAFVRARSQRLAAAQGILPESAQRFRDAYEFIAGKQSVLLASALVYAVLFGLASCSGSARVLVGTEVWLVALVAVLVSVVAGYALYRLCSMALLGRRLRACRNANILVGQALQKVTGTLNRIFHDLRCGGGVIDHLLVGQKGIYAVYVIARRPGRHNRLRARDARLWFAPGRESLALDKYSAMTHQLTNRLRKVIGGQLRVRTVVVVPGWEVEQQAGNDCLVVNERNLVMLRGWNDRDEYLMNEDVELLHEHLAAPATRVQPPGDRRLRSAGG